MDVTGTAACHLGSGLFAKKFARRHAAARETCGQTEECGTGQEAGLPLSIRRVRVFQWTARSSVAPPGLAVAHLRDSGEGCKNTLRRKFNAQ